MINKYILFISVIGLSAFAESSEYCSSYESGLNKLAKTTSINPLEKSVPAYYQDFPWVGKIGGCSGTLVAPDIVLTAAHCFKGKGKSLTKAPFYLGYENEVALTETEGELIASGDYKTPSDRDEDWAIVRLKSPVNIPGLKYPNISSESLSSLKDKPLTIVGYPNTDRNYRNGQVMYVQSNCYIKGRYGFLSDKSFAHNCVAGKGNSGGPILTKSKDGQWEIVGLHSGAGRFSIGEKTNFAVATSPFRQALTKALAGQ